MISLLFADMFSISLRYVLFPKEWKRQKLVLILKPGKQIGEPQSFRPIGVLVTLSKTWKGFYMED